MMPSDVEKIRVCSSTGLLASYGCNVITEYFAKDTAPTEYCSKHSYRYYENSYDDDSSSSSSSGSNSSNTTSGDNSGNGNSGADNSGGNNSGGDNTGAEQ